MCFFLYLQICVETCPDNFWAVGPLDYIKEPKEVFQQNICVPSIDLEKTEMVSTKSLMLQLRPNPGFQSLNSVSDLFLDCCRNCEQRAVSFFLHAHNLR